MQIGSKFLRFQDNRDLTVIDIDGSMAILDNGEKLAIQRLLDRSKFELLVVGAGKASVINTNENINNNDQSEESFDLTSSTKSIASIISNGLENIDISDITELPDIPSVKMGGVVENSRPKPGVENSIIDKQKEQDILNKYKQKDKKIQRGQTLSDLVDATNKTSPPKINKDPTEDFFSGIKRTEDLELDIRVNEKIPNKGFIVAMEENHEKSIIEYLANDIFSNIMENPKELKKNIETALREKIGVAKKEKQENAED